MIMPTLTKGHTLKGFDINKTYLDKKWQLRLLSNTSKPKLKFALSITASKV